MLGRRARHGDNDNLAHASDSGDTTDSRISIHGEINVLEGIAVGETQVMLNRTMSVA
jgi:hypothetical protein